jgi:hypothetical protein
VSTKAKGRLTLQRTISFASYTLLASLITVVKIACVVVAMKTYLELYFTAKYIGNERPGD